MSLTFSSLGYTSTVSNTNILEAFLEYRYGVSMCTNFDHTLSQNSFTGKALLTGEAWVVATTNETITNTVVSIGTAPPLTLTVVDSTFDTIGSTGSCDMTGSFVVQTAWSVDGNDVTFGTVTGASVTVELFLEMLNATSVTGVANCDYDTLPGPNSLSTGSAPYTLLRTGTCPV